MIAAPRRWLVSALVAAAAPSLLAFAQSPLVDGYVAATQLARAGQTGPAYDRLAALARDYPSSAAVHRALALLAPETGHAASLESALTRRLARSPRDVGASVGLAVLAARRGAPGSAHALLARAVDNGARDLQLAALLVETNPDGAALGAWFERLARRLPRDPLLAGLRGRALLLTGRVDAARDAIEAALGRGLEHPDLLALHAAVLHATGDETAACVDAAQAAGLLGTEAEVPEVRVPRRLVLAHVLSACGHDEQARRLLATLGPTVTLPGTPALRPLARAAAARIAAGRQDPLGALDDLAQDDDANQAPFAESRLAARAAAYALIGLPDASSVEAALGPPPEGLALADRAETLAALAAAGSVPAERLVPAIDLVAARLEAQRLQPRAARLRCLEAYLLAGRDPYTAQALLERLPRHPGPRAAAALAAARAVVELRLMRPGTPFPPLDMTRFAGAPGGLLARLRATEGRAALAQKIPARARQCARDGLLDLQEADRSRVVPPPELAALAGNTDDLALELAGLSFAASLADGAPVERAGATFAHDLGRATRSWSMLQAPWPSTPERLGDFLSEGSCLVIAVPGDDAPALVVAPRGRWAAVPPDEVLTRSACASAGAVFWAGPRPAPGGLAVAVRDERLLIRVVSPAPMNAVPGPAGRSKPPVPALLDGGEATALRRLVETLAGPPPTTGAPPAEVPPADRWVAYGGAGLALARVPYASGWLVPRGRLDAGGWAGPETLSVASPAIGPGIVALGLRAVRGRAEPERGAWVLAEASLTAGWRWALLSQRPLTPSETARLLPRLPALARTPLPEARRIARSDPELGQALAFWTVPGRIGPPETAPDRARTLALLALGATLAVLLAGALFRRGRSADRLSRRPDRRDRPN